MIGPALNDSALAFASSLAGFKQNQTQKEKSLDLFVLRIQAGVPQFPLYTLRARLLHSIERSGSGCRLKSFSKALTRE